VMLFFAKKKIDDQVDVYNHINVLNIRVVFTNLKTTKIKIFYCWLYLWHDAVFWLKIRNRVLHFILWKNTKLKKWITRN